MTSKKRDQKRVYLVAVRDDDPSVIVEIFSFSTQEGQKAFAGEAERKGLATMTSDWRQVHGASVADTSRAGGTAIPASAECPRCGEEADPGDCHNCGHLLGEEWVREVWEREEREREEAP